MSVVDDAVLNYSDNFNNYCSRIQHYSGGARINFRFRSLPGGLHDRRARPPRGGRRARAAAARAQGGGPVCVSMRWCSGYHIAEASISASLQNQPKLPVRTSLVPSCAQTVASTAVSK